MDIADLHGAIGQQLQQMFPAMDVLTYPDLTGRVSLPMLLIELAEFSDGTQPGNGELSLIARFEARLVVDPSRAHAEMQIRQLVCRLAAAIHFKTWGQPVGLARIQSVAPDGFKGELEGYLVWCVTFEHEIHVGDAEDWPVPEPGELLLGITTGSGPAEEYRRPEDILGGAG